MSTPIAARLIEDPEVAANIGRLVEQTGIPLEGFAEWLASDPPPGDSRADWLDALASTSEAPPLTPEQLEELARIVAPSLRSEAA